MIEQNRRRTKVIKSFEAKVLNEDEARLLLTEEVDVVRIVYSREHAARIQSFVTTFRKIENPSRPQAVMIDISSWSQAFVADLKEPVEAAFGSILTLSQNGGGKSLKVRTEVWDQLFLEGSKVFLGSGSVTCKVQKLQKSSVDLEVLQGGTIFPDMDIAVPDTRKLADKFAVSVADIADLVRSGIDYVLVPGQWESRRIAEFRAEIKKICPEFPPWILLKVDSPESYEMLPSLIESVDGVLISRREMALMLNAATIPMITKEIIQLCNNHAKVVITASEMLASMRRNITPTRAEVSDVANAVLDGTDGVVLSEEVANGKYRTQAVDVMHRIISDIEGRDSVAPNWIKHSPAVTNEMDAIAYNAYKTAERIRAKAIVCITVSGNTALKLASFRAPVPVIAVTFSPAVRRRLSVVRGVEALHLDVNPSIDDVLPVVNDQLVRGSWLRTGDPIIFVSITLSPVGRESSNLFTVQTLT